MSCNDPIIKQINSVVFGTSDCIFDDLMIRKYIGKKVSKFSKYQDDEFDVASKSIFKIANLCNLLSGSNPFRILDRDVANQL